MNNCEAYVRNCIQFHYPRCTKETEIPQFEQPIPLSSILTQLGLSEQLPALWNSILIPSISKNIQDSLVKKICFYSHPLFLPQPGSYHYAILCVINTSALSLGTTLEPNGDGCIGIFVDPTHCKLMINLPFLLNNDACFILTIPNYSIKTRVNLDFDTIYLFGLNQGIDWMALKESLSIPVFPTIKGKSTFIKKNSEKFKSFFDSFNTKTMNDLDSGVFFAGQNLLNPSQQGLLRMSDSMFYFIFSDCKCLIDCLQGACLYLGMESRPSSFQINQFEVDFDIPGFPMNPISELKNFHATFEVGAELVVDITEFQLFCGCGSVEFAPFFKHNSGQLTIAYLNKQIQINVESFIEQGVVTKWNFPYNDLNQATEIQFLYCNQLAQIIDINTAIQLCNEISPAIFQTLMIGIQMMGLSNLDQIASPNVQFKQIWLMVDGKLITDHLQIIWGIPPSENKRLNPLPLMDLDESVDMRFTHMFPINKKSEKTISTEIYGQTLIENNPWLLSLKVIRIGQEMFFHNSGNIYDNRVLGPIASVILDQLGVKFPLNYTVEKFDYKLALGGGGGKLSMLKLFCQGGEEPIKISCGLLLPHVASEIDILPTLQVQNTVALEFDVGPCFMSSLPQYGWSISKEQRYRGEIYFETTFEKLCSSLGLSIDVFEDIQPFVYSLKLQVQSIEINPAAFINDLRCGFILCNGTCTLADCVGFGLIFSTSDGINWRYELSLTMNEIKPSVFIAKHKHLDKICTFGDVNVLVNNKGIRYNGLLVLAVNESPLRCLPYLSTRTAVPCSGFISYMGNPCLQGEMGGFSFLNMVEFDDLTFGIITDQSKEVQWMSNGKSVLTLWNQRHDIAQTLITIDMKSSNLSTKVHLVIDDNTNEVLPFLFLKNTIFYVLLVDPKQKPAIIRLSGGISVSNGKKLREPLTGTGSWAITAQAMNNNYFEGQLDPFSWVHLLQATVDIVDLEQYSIRLKTFDLRFKGSQQLDKFQMKFTKTKVIAVPEDMVVKEKPKKKGTYLTSAIRIMGNYHADAEWELIPGGMKMLIRGYPLDVGNGKVKFIGSRTHMLKKVKALEENGICIDIMMFSNEDMNKKNGHLYASAGITFLGDEMDCPIVMHSDGFSFQFSTPKSLEFLDLDMVFLPDTWGVLAQGTWTLNLQDDLGSLKINGMSILKHVLLYRKLIFNVSMDISNQGFQVTYSVVTKIAGTPVQISNTFTSHATQIKQLRREIGKQVRDIFMKRLTTLITSSNSPIVSAHELFKLDIPELMVLGVAMAMPAFDIWESLKNVWFNELEIASAVFIASYQSADRDDAIEIVRKDLSENSLSQVLSHIGMLRGSNGVAQLYKGQSVAGDVHVSDEYQLSAGHLGVDSIDGDEIFGTRKLSVGGFSTSDGMNVHKINSMQGLYFDFEAFDEAYVEYSDDDVYVYEEEDYSRTSRNVVRNTIQNPDLTSHLDDVVEKEVDKFAGELDDESQKFLNENLHLLDASVDKSNDFSSKLTYSLGNLIRRFAQQTGFSLLIGPSGTKLLDEKQLKRENLVQMDDETIDVAVLIEKSLLRLQQEAEMLAEKKKEQLFEERLLEKREYRRQMSGKYHDDHPQYAGNYSTVETETTIPSDEFPFDNQDHYSPEMSMDSIPIVGTGEVLLLGQTFNKEQSYSSKRPKVNLPIRYGYEQADEEPKLTMLPKKNIISGVAPVFSFPHQIKVKKRNPNRKSGAPRYITEVKTANEYSKESTVTTDAKEPEFERNFIEKDTSIMTLKRNANQVAVFDNDGNMMAMLERDQDKILLQGNEGKYTYEFLDETMLDESRRREGGFEVLMNDQNHYLIEHDQVQNSMNPIALKNNAFDEDPIALVPDGKGSYNVDTTGKYSIDDNKSNFKKVSRKEILKIQGDTITNNKMIKKPRRSPRRRNRGKNLLKFNTTQRYGMNVYSKNKKQVAISKWLAKLMREQYSGQKHHLSIARSHHQQKTIGHVKTQNLYDATIPSFPSLKFKRKTVETVIFD
eukprot:TRINITY_DN3290_c0_g1_i1.p1 TRINITY_DN3290_c0_g1~~TRINITY_DN3290_c0_g1_i1.p1  ORF type:complete len:2003 (-),score=486.94 TRINITY_DN3290_c0_g1_i1:11-5983(-)